MSFSTLNICAQTYVIKGKVSNSKLEALENVNIVLLDNPTIGTTTDIKGNFELRIYETGIKQLKFTHLEYADTIISVSVPQNSYLKIILKEKVEVFKPIEITAKTNREHNIEKINPKLVTIIPDASGGIEATLKALPGVSKTNELSSQYSVRGGNFDENLVYVNNVEVYRPTLIRSGQQEGLSFVNPDMVSNIYFSAGGFDAKYGDKMSSVLDIQYKKPLCNAINLTASLMGTSFTVENSSKNHRFTHISGIRYKTNEYLLKTLDTKGDYKPRFFDYQTFITYDISERWELNFLGNISQNHYRFIPETRETSFGTIDEALKLKIYFDGQESDKYTTAMGSWSLINKPNDNTNLYYTISTYYINEREYFDILGQYFLNELDKQLGSNTMGDSLMNIGIGSFLNHARNRLNSSIVTIQHSGKKLNDDCIIQWGVNASYEQVNDKLHEWVMLDSAGYSLPYTDSVVGIYSLIYAKNKYQHIKNSAFIQYHNVFNIDSSKIEYTLGIRSSYTNFSNELLISPRFSIFYMPKAKNNIRYKLSTGYYYQPSVV